MPLAKVPITSIRADCCRRLRRPNALLLDRPAVGGMDEGIKRHSQQDELAHLEEMAILADHINA